MPIWVWLLLALVTGTLVGLCAWAAMAGTASAIADMTAEAIGIALAIAFIGGIAVFTLIDIADWAGIVHIDDRPARPVAGCDSNYTGACLNPNAGDYDCAGGSGDGPNYTGTVTVIGADVYGLDRDGNGIGCQ